MWANCFGFGTRFALILKRRWLFQEAGMLFILGEKRFDFRPQIGVVRAGFFKKRCPGLARHFACRLKQVRSFLVSFRRDRSVLQPIQSLRWELQSYRQLVRTASNDAGSVD